MHRNRGFSLVELILLITLVGLIAVYALPRFLTVSAEAKQVTKDAIVGSIRTSISLYYTKDAAKNDQGRGTYPATLDSASTGICSSDNLCFAGVLMSGVDDTSWSKTGPYTYTYNDGERITTYTYNKASGTFR